MNPKEFSWTEDQQVTVTNPTAEAYKFKVHNKEYQLGPGKSAKMPGYIAWVYVYGMATQLAQADGNFMRWNEEGYRQEYYDKVVSGVDPIMQTIDEIEDEPAVRTFDEEPLEEPEEPEEPSTPATPAPPVEEPAQPEPATAPAGVKPMEAKPRGRSASRA